MLGHLLMLLCSLAGWWAACRLPPATASGLDCDLASSASDWTVQLHLWPQAGLTDHGALLAFT